MRQDLYYDQPFVLESGKTLPGINIGYHTYGKLNAEKDNVVWVCHALTASSDAVDWWPGLIGDGCIIDADEHFIVCANILGSCYGSTGPASIDPVSGQPYLASFPLITIRDMVNAHIVLRKHLGLDKITLLMGGSMGGYQVLEWALMEPQAIQRLCLLATSAAESAWGIAIHTAQRLAIEADTTWDKNEPNAGAKGLKAARAIGMLTYRTYHQFHLNQTDDNNELVDNFKASSYIRYQGDKLVKRFNAPAYYTLSKAMDTHNISRGRAKDIATVLKTIKQPALLIGIDSDILCPVEEQRMMAEHMPGITYKEIHSDFGHDGFLIEVEQISALMKEWFSTQRS